MKIKRFLFVLFPLFLLALNFLTLTPLSISAANLVVSNAANSGLGTLRDILSSAVAGTTITFDPLVFPPGNPTTIFIQSSLPTINQNNIIIDGSNAGVILDGTQTPASTNGLVIGADSVAIRGLTIQRFSGNGILLTSGTSNTTLGGDRTLGSGPNGQGNQIILNGANGIDIRGIGTTNNIVIGNFIGVDISGTWEQGNSSNGITIWQSANNNTIGSTNSNMRNFISGNGGNGVWIAGEDSDQNRIISNYIGTRVDGLGPIPNNLSGVSIQDSAKNNYIGDALAGAGNLISGNSDNGVYIGGDGTNENQVLGNIIGPNHLGTGFIGQGANGISITDGASFNIVGDGTLAGRNLISRNSYHGVLIEFSETSNNKIQGNYIGTNIAGASALPNFLHGVAMTEGAHHNLLGGNQNIGNGPLGQGNLISGNSNHGLVITSGAHDNTASGNIIGPDVSGTYSLGYHVNGGIDIAEGAHSNLIGGSNSGDENLISGNQTDGIALFDNTGAGTYENEIINNIIGLTLAGNQALPNRGAGIFLVKGTDKTIISDNTISGNITHGVQMSGATAENSILQNNLIGTDITGLTIIGNGGFGVLLSEKTNGHQLEFNTISGNQQGGVSIQDLDPGLSAHDNVVQDNRIGTDITGISPLGNNGPGVQLLEGAYNNTIGPNNIIGFNAGNGLHITTCDKNNTITQNSIYNNIEKGIISDCLATPELTAVTENTIQGNTVGNATVEIFSDYLEQGQWYEATVTANSNGDFIFSGPFTGPNVTVVSSDQNGNVSSYSENIHTLWTILLYMNGDNDLEDALFNTQMNIANAGASPIANVLAIIDGNAEDSENHSETVLYDLTRGAAVSIETNIGITNSVPAELNMGDPQTLIDFVTWGKDNYPSKHTLLSIIDHGGGWAPSTTDVLSNTLPISRRQWQAGVSGISWDFTDDYEFLDIKEMRQLLSTITNDGTNKLDVVFYDVCLMGLTEVAYDLRNYASYFVSSQNIGWAPFGPENRYVKTIQDLDPTTTPQQMSQFLVQNYANSLPTTGHPFTISAIDLSLMPNIASDVSQLGDDLLATINNTNQTTEILHQAYLESQKIDYDSDFQIEQETDGFVDVYDFSTNVIELFEEPTIVNSAQALQNTLNSAIVAEEHQSGVPWSEPPDNLWNLDDTRGLSLFLPLGEDLELPLTTTVTIAPGVEITRNIRLREMYTADQLEFVEATNWNQVINKYYDLVQPIAGVTEGPVASLADPDVTPPDTTVAVNGDFTFGQEVTITWDSEDAESGLASASLWYKPAGEPWQHTGQSQQGSSGIFSAIIPEPCTQKFSVRAMDNVGNVEPVENSTNWINIPVPCVFSPIVAKQ